MYVSVYVVQIRLRLRHPVLYVFVSIYATAFTHTCVKHTENGSQHPSSQASSNAR